MSREAEPAAPTMVEIAHFSSRLEAETIGHALDQYEIPFMVQSPDVGMFGPGMIGTSAQGAKLLVPSDRLAEVQTLLDCVVNLDGGELSEPVPDELRADDTDTDDEP